MGSILCLDMKKYIPISLTTLRLALGPIALPCASAQVSRIWFLPILLTGLLSDIYDGVLARRWGVATTALRRYDSMTDVVYYLFILAATWICADGLLIRYWPLIVALVLAEVVCLAVSFSKFHGLPAIHSYLAKFYGLALFGTFVAILGFGGPMWVVPVLAVIGLVADLEIVAILLRAKSPPVDVISVFHLKHKSTITSHGQSLMPNQKARC